MTSPAHKVRTSSSVLDTTTARRFNSKTNGSYFCTTSDAEKTTVLKTLSATYSLDCPGFCVAP